MRRPWHGAMPVTLTLPVGLHRRPRVRQRRLRRLAFVALIALGVALLAAGFWLPAKAELAQGLLNRAWQRGAADTSAKPWADTHAVARLTLPDSGEALTVFAGAPVRNLAVAPALLDGSAAPGEHGVTVIAGDRDTYFRRIGTLALGDKLTLERRDGSVLNYVVADLDVVDSARAELRAEADESIVVLVPRSPFEAVTPAGSLRYVVTARQRF